MRKFTLLIASLFITIGAMAQTPVLELTSEQIGTSYPYELPEADAQNVYALTDLTVAVKVNTATMSGRRALFCTADPTQAANSTAMGKNSFYVAYGTSDNAIGYLASWKAGDRFTKSTVPANTDGVVLVYVINPSANTCKLYVNGTMLGSWVNAHTDGFMSGYEIATPGMVKADHNNAKIYIGGGVNSSGNSEVFNGTIVGVKVFDGVLTNEQIAEVFAEPVTELTDEQKAAAKEEVNAIPTGVGYPTATAKEAYCTAVDAATTTAELNELKAEMLADVNNYEMPAADKVYALDSYMNYLCNKIDGTTALKTNGSSATDTKALWKFIAVEGGYKIQNVHTGLYINDVTMSETPGVFRLEVTAEENGTQMVTMGKFYIKIGTSGANCIHSTSENTKSWSGAGLGNQYSFVEVDEFSHTLNVTDAGWATVVLGFNAAIPTTEGFKAYTIASQEDGYVTLAEATGVLAANVPVLVNAPAGNYDFAYTTEETTVTESALQGTLYNKNIEEEAYVLGNVSGVGLYKAVLNQAEGTAFLNNANKAYFVPTNTLASAASYSFRFGEGTTGIEQITDNREQSTAIYDLTGRRVEAISAPGIYIINGKKVLVK